MVKTIEGAVSYRHLGTVLLKVGSGTVDLYDLVPNPEQPRMGPKDDPELRKSIVENNGIFEPILAEPHPEHKGKLQIIDGERRWENCKILVEVEKKDQFRELPVQITDRTLTKDERLRAWVTIHRHRKDWRAKERERTAHKLIQEVGRASAANILGMTVRQVDALEETFELSERMSKLEDPDASISYAREIKSLARYLRPPKVENSIVKKVNEGLINTSKEIRELRSILKDPKAREVFLQDGTPIEDAKAVMPPSTPPSFGQTFAQEIDMFTGSLLSHPWPELVKLKGDPSVIEKIRKCKKILDDIEDQLA